MNETRTLEQLIEMGGKFYAMGGIPYCDTATQTWRFDPSAGVYVLCPDE